MSLYVDIEKKLGDFLLKVKFETGEETFSLLGASGSGKSLTLKCIAGVATPDKGVIMLDDRVLFDSEKKINLSPGERKIGYLFQDYALFPNMTVQQNIMCGIQSGNKAEKQEEARRYIEKFYLAGTEKQYPSQLSGGQKQRVALARMLAAKPEMILLDEPFSALDNYLKWQLEQEVMKVIAQYDKKVLLISHDRNEVFRLTDKIAVMENGQLLEIQEKQDLFRHPETLSAALLTGCKNITRLEWTGEGCCKALDWGIDLRSPEGIGVDLSFAGFRANFFEIVEAWEPVNVVECEVEQIIEDVFSYIVLLRQKNNQSQAEWSLLRYEISKIKWEELGRNIRYLKMPAEKIIWMKR